MKKFEKNFMEISKKEVEYLCWRTKEFCMKVDREIDFQNEEDMKDYFLRKVHALPEEKRTMNAVYVSPGTTRNPLECFCDDLRSINQIYFGKFQSLSNLVQNTVFVSIFSFNKRIISLTGEVKEKIRKLRS